MNRCIKMGLVPMKSLAALVVFALSLGAAASASGNDQGYIEMNDGVGLRYTVYLPEGEGPFPVLLQYSGYGPGTNPYDNGLEDFGPRMRDQGFAILGVNMRGTRAETPLPACDTLVNQPCRPDPQPSSAIRP